MAILKQHELGLRSLQTMLNSLGQRLYRSTKKLQRGITSKPEDKQLVKQIQKLLTL